MGICGVRSEFLHNELGKAGLATQQPCVSRSATDEEPPLRFVPLTLQQRGAEEHAPPRYQIIKGPALVLEQCNVCTQICRDTKQGKQAYLELKKTEHSI